MLYPLSDNRGIENTELVMLIAIVVVAAAAAWGFFGGQLSSFIRGLPGKLGFG